MIEKNLDILKNLNIMFIDDDSSKLEEMQMILEFFFNKVYVYEDPVVAYDDFIKKKNRYDVVMTDLRMPKLNGLEISKKIRSVNYNIPIYICSTHTEIEDLLESIRLNLIDYIVKPVSFDKFKKAFSLLVERFDNNDEISDEINLRENVTYSKSMKTAIVDNEEVTLTKKESLLLELLISNINRLVTKEQIEEQVYDYSGMTDHAMRNLVWRLRKKLDNVEINTVKNLGLKLIVDH